ncbi:transcription factor bHLH [Forsythia ovata]|uniref:Transcription factor bHLH n=1 Tax=Forsythia ovata TaxID=205694 RepID=A0ABD1X9A2_9LAMI
MDMDNNFSMFSLLQDDDYLLENPSFSVTYSDSIIPQDPGIDHASLGSIQVQGTTLNIDDKKGKRKCKSYDKCPKDGLQKKEVHRDVERQRRQEMANLYDSLRSVIPPELLKVKKYISFFDFYVFLNEILYQSLNKHIAGEY